MKVHILILNFNGEELLRKYLPSYCQAVKNSRHDCRVSVVDNASTDASQSVVAGFNSVGWMPMAQNRVLCAYNEAATGLPDEILILMNNDIRVDAGFVDPLVQPFLNSKDVFFVTPQCLSLKTGDYEGNKTRGRLRFGIFWAYALYPGYEKEKDSPGLTFQGGFGAFDRKKFLELGGYDDLYLPGRLEDADICFRAQKKGWVCLYEPASRAWHEGGTSFHRAFGVHRTLVINARNTFLFMWKNLGDRDSFLRFFFWLPFRLAYSLFSGKPELFLGFWQALPHLPRVYRRRQGLKKSGLLTSRPDRQIFGVV
ncbi:MAG: glycosyltransferase family 2 protein [Candidatus Omnitrophica bacterium]|nr:glycosyltransferase family 2 protein [Candidatus Omnitrophota bacterium]